jgi:hypothetical protein
LLGDTAKSSERLPFWHKITFFCRIVKVFSAVEVGVGMQDLAKMAMAIAMAIKADP